MELENMEIDELEDEFFSDNETGSNHSANFRPAPIFQHQINRANEAP